MRDGWVDILRKGFFLGQQREVSWLPMQEQGWAEARFSRRERSLRFQAEQRCIWREHLSEDLELAGWPHDRESHFRPDWIQVLKHYLLFSLVLILARRLGFIYSWPRGNLRFNPSNSITAPTGERVLLVSPNYKNPLPVVRCWPLGKGVGWGLLAGMRGFAVTREAIVTISFILPQMNSRYEKDFFLLLYIFTNKFSVACIMIFFKSVFKNIFLWFHIQEF